MARIEPEVGTTIPFGPAARRELALLVSDPFFAERLFDRMPDVVFFVKNVKKEYVVVNDTLVRRCGVATKSDLIGRTTEDVFPAPLGAHYAEQDRQVIATGTEIFDRLELHLYSDRTRGWCLTHKIPLVGRDQRVIGLAGLSRDLHHPHESRAGYRGIAEAVEFLHAHYDEPIRVENLARLAKIPVDRFQRLVRRIFQLTPGQLIIKIRLEAAAHLLVETAQSVAEVAYACGYSDHSAFTRQFRAATGLTPTHFRRVARHPRAPDAQEP
jgi:AraC-like DNA-binding protein